MMLILIMCRLKKWSLYGLNQAPRIWYDTLKASLLNIGFKRCNLDFFLFFKKSDTGFSLIFVYVDDILVCGDESSKVLRILESLQTNPSKKG